MGQMGPISGLATHENLRNKLNRLKDYSLYTEKFDLISSQNLLSHY
jgi:hypothetical protein